MTEVAFEIGTYLCCLLLLLCWDCLYFGLFALPLQNKQGMVSEKGKRRVKRWRGRLSCELHLIDSGAKTRLCFERLQATNSYLSCEQCPSYATGKSYQGKNTFVRWGICIKGWKQTVCFKICVIWHYTVHEYTVLLHPQPQAIGNEMWWC